MAKRPYTKRSEYWDKFKKKEEPKGLSLMTRTPDYEPELLQDGLLQSINETQASRLSDSSSRSKARTNRITTGTVSNRFANIENGLLPYDYSSDHVDVSDAIVLSQKAYFNVPVYKATVDLMSEFADSDIYLTGGTTKSKNFIKGWFKKINVERVKEQFFREFYRSGNIFFNRFDAELTENGVRKAVQKYGVSNAAKGKIPVRYQLLNPAEIASQNTLQFEDFQYVKMLTTFELAALKKRESEQEAELFDSLPEELQKAIMGSGSYTNKEVFLPLDPKKLHYIFYKKQDYEPFAIPMGFCVLDDINKKMELKKVDQAIARSVENVILLVTMGAEPDKGGINHKNLSAMQDIFRNKSVGRVLVADYTTKADFVIPDMKKVLGKEKYEVLNEDIREGLQNIMLGDSKYADAQLKLRVFFQRLDEARNIFLRDFLQPEVDRVAKEMGLRNPPKVNFARLDTMDNAALQKLATRMMELNILTPEQGLEVINTGVFPDSESLDDAQKKYKEQRDKEYFIPLTNNANLIQIESQEEIADKGIEMQKRQQMGQQAQNPQKPNTGRPTGTTEINRGPQEANAFSISAITKTVKEFESFGQYAKKAFKKKKGLTRLNKDQKKTVEDLCEKIVTTASRENWESVLDKVCENHSEILNLNTHEDILSLAEEHGLDEYPASILYHSTKVEEEE